MRDDGTADRSGGARRAADILRFVALTALAALALPWAAWLVERVADGAENWIFPVQLILVGLLAVGYQSWRTRRGGTTRGNRTSMIRAAAATAGAVMLADAVWLLAIAG